MGTNGFDYMWVLLPMSDDYLWLMITYG
jgi:hypothetical protein